MTRTRPNQRVSGEGQTLSGATVQKLVKNPQVVEYTKRLLDTTDSSLNREDKFWKKEMISLVQAQLIKTDRFDKHFPKTFNPFDAKQVVERFGLHGIEFGRYLNQYDRYNYMFSGVLSLNDLAYIVRIPVKKVGLDGRITMSYGARGHGGFAAAHFEPDSYAINLTRYPEVIRAHKNEALITSGGVSALAHEYGHAIDRFLAEKFKLETEFVSGNHNHVRMKFDSSLIALNDIRGVMERFFYDLYHKEPGVKSAFYNKMKQLLQKDEYSDYWVRRTEIFARFFEAWVHKEMKKRNWENNFLTMPKYDAEVYPQANDIKRAEPHFRQLLDKLHNNLMPGKKKKAEPKKEPEKTKKTGQAVTFYDQAGVKMTKDYPNDRATVAYEILDPSDEEQEILSKNFKYSRKEGMWIRKPLDEIAEESLIKLREINITPGLSGAGPKLKAPHSFKKYHQGYWKKGFLKNQKPGKLEKAIYRYKNWGHDLDVIKKALDEYIDIFEDIDYIIPVNKEHSQYDIAHAMAEYITQEASKSDAYPAHKVVKLPALKKGNRQLKNGIKTKVKDKHILIVDDIVRTGVTKNRALRALEDCEPKKVTLFSLTKGNK